MDTIKPLFTATATATGGLGNGHTELSDHMVRADLSVPKAMGGPGKPGTATPEHLFAAGYAACFGGALDFVGKQHKKDASKRRASPPTCRSGREMAAVSGSRSSCTSRIKACRRRNWRRSPRRRTRKSARTRTPRAATSTCSSDDKGAGKRKGRHVRRPFPSVEQDFRKNGVRILPDRMPYICVMSRSLVSGRKMSPTTKLIAATAIGYQRPE